MHISLTDPSASLSTCLILFLFSPCLLFPCHCSRSQDSLFSKPEEDTTQLIITLRMTQICGVVPLVYGMLLHSGVFSKGLSPAPSPTQSPKHTLDVAEVCLNLLNHVALVDLQMLQVLWRDSLLLLHLPSSSYSASASSSFGEGLVTRRVASKQLHANRSCARSTLLATIFHYVFLPILCLTCYLCYLPSGHSRLGGLVPAIKAHFKLLAVVLLPLE